MNRIALLGHSFISRLERDYGNLPKNFGFDADIIRVACLGRRGGQIRHLFLPPISTDLISIRPHVVLLQIGGNDLDAYEPIVSYDFLVQDLIVLAEWLIDVYDVRQVGIMQLLYRSSTRHRPVADYNRAVEVVNSTLKAKCAAADKYFFWRHKGLKDGIFNNSCLSADGVHLSAAGSKKYRCSIRAAIRHGLRLAHL